MAVIAVRQYRSAPYHVRHVLVIGCGPLASRLISNLHNPEECCCRVVGGLLPDTGDDMGGNTRDDLCRAQACGSVAGVPVVEDNRRASRVHCAPSCRRGPAGRNRRCRPNQSVGGFGAAGGAGFRSAARGIRRRTPLGRGRRCCFILCRTADAAAARGAAGGAVPVLQAGLRFHPGGNPA